MRKSMGFLIIILISVIIFCSGCIDSKEVKKTWGEKNISLSLIKLANNTTSEHYTHENQTYYYVEGYLLNDNAIDALEIMCQVKFYDSKGNLVKINKTPYLNPKNIPAKGYSLLYAEIQDPENLTNYYEVEIISAKAEY